MAKALQEHPISQSDLIQFLETSSDFAFELLCLKTLSSLGFECKHGGSYTDPVTKKTRQFDIRAGKSQGPLHVHCAVECKRLTDAFPLLVMCVPRVSVESFHDLVASYHPSMVPQSQPIPAFEKICETIRAKAPYSEYRMGEPVGKSCAQVGRSRDGSLTGNDAEVFEKWAQALASADDLADQAARQGKKRNDAFISLILPILVVPDQTLWVVNFQADGSKRNDPIQTDRCSFFVGQHYSAGAGPLQSTSMIVSHLEFVTLTGLKQLASDVFSMGNRWFPVKNGTDDGL